MTEVEVHHVATGDGLVARITVDPELTAQEALEFAYRRTQNVEGSWSKGPWVHDARNWDHHPSVSVVKPLQTLNGISYGHRSSMVGDELVFQGKRYKVAPSGFEVV